MKKLWTWMLLVAMVMSLIAIGGCKKKPVETEPVSTEAVTEAPTTEPETEEETEPETEEETEPETEEEGLAEGMMYSYLSGLPVPEEIGLKRPTAVMLNNIKAACPQTGINEAEVVYEAPVEGGINRFMAVFEDVTDMEKIGSVRSARTYFVYFAYEFRAIYVHAGQAIFAQLHLDSANCHHLNALDNSGNGVFYRTTDRPSPHNLYASGQGIQNACAANGFPMPLSFFDGYDDYRGHYQFAIEEPELLENGIDAKKVIPGYPYNEPWFEYNEEDGLYYRYQYGAPHCDTEGVQVSVNNILIQSTPCQPYYDTQYLNFDVQAGGNGYYITNGKAIPVTWSKEYEWAITRYFDADGNEIMLNPGKTWVCVIDNKYENRIQILGE